jgi:hypothetical protein
VMIGGFALGGNNNPSQVAVRARGPSMSSYGLTNLLADPTLELHNADGTMVITNDDWESDPVSAAELTAHGLALSDPKESGIFTSLPPGQFTAIVAGKNGGVGIALVEIYNIKELFSVTDRRGASQSAAATEDESSGTYRDRRAEVCGLIELARFPVRQADAAVRGRHTRQVALVQPVPGRELDEEGHGCALEMGVRRFRILAAVDIAFHYPAGIVDIIAVETGAMVDVFPNYGEPPNRRAVPLPPARDARRRSAMLSPVEVSLLFAEIDDDGRFPRVAFGHV